MSTRCLPFCNGGDANSVTNTDRPLAFQEPPLTPLLEDLAELTQCHGDEKAGWYIAEAVASYPTGAFRSAIVMTWIAVCSDIAEKLRDLALAGDKESERQDQDVDATRRTRNLTPALQFECEQLD
jgi:hypothetical protein